MRILSAIAFVCVLADLSASAAPARSFPDFATGPAQFLLTKEEKAQWEKVATEADAKAFVELFWARRDPTPGTPANEYRTLIDDRVKAADSRFTEAKTPGSATDRGKVFMVLGSPTKIRRAGQPGGGTIQGPTTFTPSQGNSVQTYSLKELWEFEQAKTPLKLGQPLVEVAFIDQYASNEWKIERVLRTDYASVFERVARSFVTQPDLTAVPVYAESTAPVLTTVAPRAGITAEPLRAAIEEARARKDASGPVFLNYGEYVTPTGEYFVPVQLYVPKATGLAADSKVTFFGMVEKAEGGETVAVFEEPVTLSATKEGVFYARSLTLPPGNYVGTFGLARDGKPLGALSRAMALQGLDHQTESVSGLILTDNVYPLKEAQNPTDPFAFGGLKVVPKGDAVFSRSGDVGYFFEVRNPGVDPATGRPNVTMRITLSGTTLEGKKVRIAGAAEPVDAQPVNGVPGHFVVGQAMPLSTFKPGNYTLALKVTDATSGKVYDLQESFQIVE